MKKKFLFILAVGTLFASAYSVYICSQQEQVMDVMLENIDANARNESGGLHGRPLLYSPNFGYKCGNCSGDDCGAVC